MRRATFVVTRSKKLVGTPGEDGSDRAQREALGLLNGDCRRDE
jgi:hypothetical protein